MTAAKPTGLMFLKGGAELATIVNQEVHLWIPPRKARPHLRLAQEQASKQTRTFAEW